MKISDEAFHQWKQNDCTVGLIKLLNDSIEIGENSILGYIKSTSDISVSRLAFYKGVLNNLIEVQEAIQNKATLEADMEGEDEVE